MHVWQWSRMNCFLQEVTIPSFSILDKTKIILSMIRRQGKLYGYSSRLLNKKFKNAIKRK